jgi:transcriptional regulator with XRE-family HTH domain
MRIENEDQNVTLETLEQLCKAFHIDVTELFPVVSKPRHYQAPLEPGQRPVMIHESKSAAKDQSGRELKNSK